MERIFNDTQTLNPPPTLVNTTWLNVALSFKECRDKPEQLRDFAKKYAGLLKRRAVLQNHPHLAAEITALESAP